MAIRNRPLLPYFKWKRMALTISNTHTAFRIYLGKRQESIVCFNWQHRHRHVRWHFPRAFCYIWPGDYLYAVGFDFGKFSVRWRHAKISQSTEE